MRLSISARIFGGFLIVLVAFAGAMGYTVHRMHRLRQDLHLINNSYLRLALILAELHIHQGNLVYTVAERKGGRPVSSTLRNQVRLARLYRQREVQAALRVLRGSREHIQAEKDRQYLNEVERRLLSLSRAFNRHDPLFDHLFSDVRAVGAHVLQESGAELHRVEGKLVDQIRRLFEELRGQVKAAAIQVEIDENNSIWVSLILAVLALAVSLVVTFGAQLTLRPLKTLVGGTKRIGSGHYAHRVEIRSRDELGELAREFNSMASAIEEREQRLIRSERMAAAGRIASHITHEIRNPLSSISLNTELLEEELSSIAGDRAGEARPICQAIRREVDRLTDITEEYLRFARLPRPHLEAEDINEILGSLLTFTAGELSQRSVRVVSELQQGLPAIDADENQLRQAFLTLVRNALEAMDGKAGGTLRVETRHREGGVQVVIGDDGAGIDAAVLGRVFEPFFSTKEGGTGLGLALTQQIIQEHGGSIAVESLPRQGTRFIVELPARRRGQCQDAAPAAG